MSFPMRPQLKTATEIVVLATVPLVLIAAGMMFRAAAGPFEADPDYVYLLNGLSLLSFHPPGHYDHPGTTLQIIVAFVTIPTWLLSTPLHGPSDLKTAVLSHPQHFLRIINLVLITANAAAAFYLGFRIRAAANFIAAIVAQTSILISFSVMIGLNRVTPEPLLLATSLVLAGYLAPLAFQPDRFTETETYALGLGALLGFVLVTKVTALPLLAKIFFLQKRNHRRTAAKAGVVTVLILTLPIAVHYPQMAKWFVRLFIHAGAYGGGPIGAPSVSNLWPAFLSLLSETPEIFVMFGFYVALFPLWSGNTRRVITISMLVLVLSIAMVLKNPGARYFMPVIGSIALANAAIVSQSLAQRGIACIGGGLLFILLAIGIWHNALTTSAWAQNAEQTQVDNQRLVAGTTVTGCRSIFFYGVNTPTYNLSFGDEYTQRHFGLDLNRIYPDALFYDVFGHQFESFFGPLSMKEVSSLRAADRCIRLVGSPVQRYDNFGISHSELSLVARTNHGLGDAVAVYAWRPK